MLALCVVNVLFRICHVQQTFRNVRHNYKWILLTLLASPPSSSPGASKSCLLSSVFLNELTWTWSAVCLTLETWTVNGLEAKVHTLPGTSNWGEKIHKPSNKGGEKMTARDPGHNIATWTLNSTASAFSKRLVWEWLMETVTFHLE